MPSEWAMNLARIAAALKAARAQGRREGMEEVARIAANGSEHVCGTLWCNDEVAHARGDVAADIRAAIAKEPTA